MNLVLCLSLIHFGTSDTVSVPEQARALLKKRVVEQWNRDPSRPPLRFDDPSCAQKGLYFHTSDALVLSAQEAAWSGRLELRNSELLDGARIPFERVSFATAPVTAAPQSSISASSPSQLRRWAPWVLGAGALVAGIFVVRAYRGKGEATPPAQQKAWSVTY